MKYYYEKPSEWVSAGKVYACDHPLYNRCTLYLEDERGLAVIQERYNENTKARWWSAVDPWLAGEIYFSNNFHDYFEQAAGEPDENGLYPTVTVRKIMWALRMKPLKKELWENEISSLK